MKKVILLLCFTCLFPTYGFPTPVSVSVAPEDTVFSVGDTFYVDLLADIELTEPVLGWGLDFNYNTSVIFQIGPPIIGPIWTPLFAPDGDNLAGSSFPLPTTGNNVLLATLNFEVIDYGTSLLEASYTIGDPTEGFPLFPVGFADVTFSNSSVSAPVPEPATILLLSLGLGGIGIAGRRKILKR